MRDSEVGREVPLTRTVGCSAQEMHLRCWQFIKEPHQIGEDRGEIKKVWIIKKCVRGVETKPNLGAIVRANLYSYLYSKFPGR